jgi:ribosomal protein S16
MLMIKLSKVGKTNKKMFRLIISEKGRVSIRRRVGNIGIVQSVFQRFAGQRRKSKLLLEKELK